MVQAGNRQGPQFTRLIFPNTNSVPNQADFAAGVRECSRPFVRDTHDIDAGMA